MDRVPVSRASHRSGSRHIWQQRFFWSKASYVGIIAGIRAGKTVVGSCSM
jgi:hypothetical protein